MTAPYVERHLSYGLPLERQSNRPIIRVAQSGSDLVPCNRHHIIPDILLAGRSAIHLSY